jgi:non-specific serine/threonine protein kinase
VQALEHGDDHAVVLGAIDAPFDLGTRPRPAARRHNLPATLSSFVGREHDLAEVKRLLAATRLLTVTGPGGIGKTRLILQAVADLLPDYVGGVWLVELGSLTDAALVASTVARVVGVLEKPGQPVVETLGDAFGDRRLLLVLDNCEHLISTCADLAYLLLMRSPSLRVLATSREPLGIPGEVTWNLPPMALPSRDAVQDPATLLQSESVRLFIERAQSALPTFELTNTNACQVVSLCRQLDGIPLALELAAARVTVMSVDQIVSRLDNRFALLGSSSRVVPARQQTLQAAVDWSYRLLSVSERRMLESLSVFAGGWTLEAAEAIAPEVTDTGSFVALDVLTQLVAKSLVIAELRADGQVRYRQLETMREFAQARLHVGDDRETAHVRHAAYYLSLAEQAAVELQGPRAVAWLDRLEVEHDNLRSALRWYLRADAVEMVQRLGSVMLQFWIVRGHFREAQTGAELILATSEAPTGLRAKVLLRAAQLAYLSGDLDASESLSERALVVSRSVSDSAQTVAILEHLGMAVVRRGNLVRARTVLEEAVALASVAGNQVAEMDALRSLARVDYLEGKLDVAWAALQRALAIAMEVGDGHGRSRALHTLGEVAYAHGDAARARALLEQSVEQARVLGDPWMLNFMQETLGYVLVDLGEDQRARSVWTECLRAWRDLGNLHHIAKVLECFAYRAAHHGELAQALRLMGAADATRRTVYARTPGEQLWLERWLPRAWATLPEAAISAARAEGEAMSIDVAIASALSAPAWENRRVSSHEVAGLTTREHQVVQLIRRGATDHEIARELVISHRTANAHVRNILSKLGLESRVQIAAWASEQELPTHVAAGKAPLT